MGPLTLMKAIKSLKLRRRFGRHMLGWDVAVLNE